MFTQKEIADALSEPLNATRGTVPQLIPHLAWKLKQQGGDIIKTNIELNTQLKTEKLVADYSRILTLKNIRNAAVVIIDNQTHNVITYVRGRPTLPIPHRCRTGERRQSHPPARQYVETIIIRTLRIDEGLMTPKAIITDVAVNYGGYAPENLRQTIQRLCYHGVCAGAFLKHTGS